MVRFHVNFQATFMVPTYKVVGSNCYAMLCWPYDTKSVIVLSDEYHRAKQSSRI